MNPRILYSATASGPAVEAVTLPQTPAGPRTHVTVYKNGSPVPATPNPAQLAASQPPAAPAPTHPWQNITSALADAQAEITPGAAPVAEPAAEQQAAPNILAQDETFTTILSPDGKMLQLYWNDGRLYTQVPFSPEAVADKLTRDQSFIRTIRTGAQGTQAVESAPAQAAPAKPLTAVEIKQQFLERAKAVAAEKFGKIDPNIQTDPIAETIAELLGENEAKRMEAEQAREEKTTEAQKINTELAWVDKISPGFDWQHPFVGKIRSSNPNWGPQQVYKEVVFWINQAALGVNGAPSAANGHAAPAQQQAFQPRLQVPAEMFAVPGGTSPQMNGANSMDNHPEVVAAVQNHERFMKQAGRTATPESTARVKQNAIMGLNNRGRFIPSLERSI